MRFIQTLAVTCVMLCVYAASADTPTLENVDRDQLRKTILPKPSESKWLTIPWEVSIWKARQRAAAEGKPILLWEMDGHPMGCT